MFTVTLLFQNITLSFEISGKNIWAPQIFKKGSKVEKSLKEKTFWQVSFSWGRDFGWKQPKSQKPNRWKVFDGDLGFRFGRIFFLTASSKQKCFGKSEPDFFPSQKKTFDFFYWSRNFFFRHIFPVFNIFNFLDTFPIFIEIPLLRFRPSNENDNFMHIIIKRLGLSCLLVRRTSENSENKKSPLQSSCVEKQ